MSGKTVKRVTPIRLPTGAIVYQQEMTFNFCFTYPIYRNHRVNIECSIHPMSLGVRQTPKCSKWVMVDVHPA